MGRTGAQSQSELMDARPGADGLGHAIFLMVKKGLTVQRAHLVKNLSEKRVF